MSKRHTPFYMNITQSRSTELLTSDAMSSNPDFCRAFSSRIRAHTSGSSCSRGSCPVHLDITHCNRAILLPPCRKRKFQIFLDPLYYWRSIWKQTQIQKKAGKENIAAFVQYTFIIFQAKKETIKEQTLSTKLLFDVCSIHYFIIIIQNNSFYSNLFF